MALEWQIWYLNNILKIVIITNYGKSTLAQALFCLQWSQKFSKSISHDLGLSVTVKSIMPYLYYDFGFCGGALFLGDYFVFFIEYVCIRLKYNCTVIGILLFGQLSFLLFQSPVGHIFCCFIHQFFWMAYYSVCF